MIPIVLPADSISIYPDRIVVWEKDGPQDCFEGAVDVAELFRRFEERLMGMFREENDGDVRT